MLLGSAYPSFLRFGKNNLIKKNHKHITHTKLSHLHSLYSPISLLWSLSLSLHTIFIFARFSNGFCSLFSLLWSLQYFYICMYLQWSPQSPLSISQSPSMSLSLHKIFYDLQLSQSRLWRPIANTKVYRERH